MITTNEISKQTKKALQAHFGKKNVSVTKGKGTACGWIHASVIVKRPLGISEQDLNSQDEAVMRVLSQERRKVHDKVDQLLNGIQFHTYTDDMNYDHSERITEVYFEGQEKWSQSQRKHVKVQVTQ